MELRKVIISQIGKIGDVVLTLPLAGYIKNLFPNCYIVFIGTAYTKPVADCCTHIDHFIDWESIKEISRNKRVNIFRKLNADTIFHVSTNTAIARIAANANIPNRIGTSRNIFQRSSINKRIKINRNTTHHHEAIFNISILNQFLNNPCNISHSNIPGLYGLTKIGESSDELKALLQPNKYNLVLHPKSNINGREWGLDKYSELFRELPVDYFNIIVTGTENEAREMEQLLKVYKNRIVDLTGKLSLNEFISLISASDGFVGCSSGPLHIASATGINAIGIYSPLKNISPERFAPLGKNATYLVKEINCNKCKNTEHCECMSSISASDVIEKLRHFYHQKFWSHGA